MQKSSHRIPSMHSTAHQDSSHTGFLPHMGFLPNGIPPTGFLPKVSSHTGFLPQDSSNTGFFPHRIPLIEFLPHDPHRIHPPEYSVNISVYILILPIEAFVLPLILTFLSFPVHFQFIVILNRPIARILPWGCNYVVPQYWGGF